MLKVPKSPVREKETQEATELLSDEDDNEIEEEEEKETKKALELVVVEEGKGDDNSECEEDRPAWGNKLQYILAQVGFSVGLGNIWRFPYMCQKNGGGAYLLPYFLLLLIVGIPLFFLELAIGQHIRRGSIGVWTYINPWLSGLGYACCVICFFVGLYYNVIIGWSIFYLFQSFQFPLPWSQCPQVSNGSSTIIEVQECVQSSPTIYFWFRETLDISDSISDGGGLNWKMVLCLLAAWVIVGLAMIKGIQSSGKVMYFSSLFPYVVLFCFFVKGILLEGAVDGLQYMFTPKLSIMLDPTVWREAATQVFFALGLGFGGVIAFSSYNSKDNDCHFDALLVSLINFFTSIFATLVVFCVMGFKANSLTERCVKENVERLLYLIEMGSLSHDLVPQHVNLSVASRTDYNLVYDVVKSVRDEDFDTLHLNPCLLEDELDKAMQGTGLAFIAFTEAMTQFPASPFWSVLFFLMLINLGLGSMFGTMEGIITPAVDTFKIRKEFFTVGMCTVAFLSGLLFVQHSGNYFVSMFDDYSATLPLIIVVILENIAIGWIYGANRFIDDIEEMIGKRPSKIYYYLWKYISPLTMTLLLVASVAQMCLSTPTYTAWNRTLAMEIDLPYPTWGLVVCGLLIIFAICPIPIVALLRALKIMGNEPGSGLVPLGYEPGIATQEPAHHRPSILRRNGYTLAEDDDGSEQTSPSVSRRIYRESESDAGSPSFEFAPNGLYGLGYSLAPEDDRAV
uniref:Transporter n=1 Tax=Eptatretus burgeri TaxID=7764 RepID=A0A8C4WXK2_EPTBU